MIDGYDYDYVCNAYLDEGYPPAEAERLAERLRRRMRVFDRNQRKKNEYIRDTRNEQLWHSQPDRGKRGQLGLCGKRRQHSGVDISVSRQDERRALGNKLRNENPEG